MWVGYKSSVIKNQGNGLEGKHFDFDEVDDFVKESYDKLSAEGKKIVGEYVDDAGSGTDLARRLGAEGENIAGITNPKTRIPSLTGTAKYRIPDELLTNPNVLREIKNVSYLSYTRQLKDFNLWAQQSGYNFILEVRQGATLSKPLLQEISLGNIILKTLGP